MTATRPPRLARLLLHLTVPRRDRPFIIHDLAEEYEARLAAGEPPVDVTRWYWRQALRSVPSNLLRSRRGVRGRPPRGTRMMLSNLGRDLRYGVRSLLRRPLFAGVVVLTLGLGTGATTAMFSVVHGVVVQPLAYEDADGLVSVWHTAPNRGQEFLNQTFATYLTYRDENRVFEDLGLWDGARVTVTGVGDPEQVVAMLVTEAVLSLLRVRPALGRVFSAGDMVPSTPVTAVLDYGYWQRRFGGDRGVIGRTVTVNGASVEIIGVTPAGFRFPGEVTDLFLPLRIDPASVGGVGVFTYQALARLRPGITIAEADADVDRMIPLAVERFPNGLSLAQLRDMGFGSHIVPLKRDVVGDVGTTLWLLFGAVAVVLVIAGVNVINLFLVRAEARRREVAVRTALGARGGQLARQFFVETLALALAGGVVGVSLAYAGVQLLVALGPEHLPRLHDVGVDAAVLAFSLGVTLLIGTVLGVLPVARMDPSDMLASLRDVGRAGMGRGRHRVRHALAVGQVALALVLLVASGLMIRSVQSLLAVNPGFERPAELLTLRISIPSAVAPEAVAAVEMHQRIVDGIRRLSGVTAAALATSVTMDGYDDNYSIFVEGASLGPDQLPRSRQVKSVSGRYFQTMGNPVVAGRAITESDVRARAPVVVVTANFTREFWPDPAQAVGKRIARGRDGPWFEIVGVVGDVYDDGVDREPTAVVFWPLVTAYDGRVSAPRSLGYAIRSARVGSPGLLAEVRRAVAAVDPNLAVSRVATLDELRRRSMARTVFTSVMFGIAAAVAMTLGLIGVYGVISYVVSQRTREIGLRMALGASHHTVSRMVVCQGATTAATGIGLGLVAAVGLTRTIGSLLHGVSAADPLTFTVVAVAVATVTVLASYFPARRAARVDPVTALRWN